MSKIKIESNSSGTGVITLVSPNTNTDRTITLPDESITLGGGVDGIVSTADATAITIDSSENVGIGMTSNLQHKLAFAENGAVGWQTSAGTNKADIKFETGGDTLQFSTTGSARLKLTTDGRGLSQFTAGAWVNFNGTGTVAIRDSHNISSIGDWGTGNFGIYIASGFSNTNYCPVGMGNDRRYMSINQDNTAPQTGRLDVYCTHANSTDYDQTHNNVVIFGDM